ncbi:MAG: hypothetical protein WB628_07980 [Candidatus Sulfotelmatobacter sp.]
MSRPSILVATPCFGGMVSQNYMLSVIRLMSYAKSATFDVSLTMLGSDALISRARSTLVAAFLDDAAATHLLTGLYAGGGFQLIRRGALEQMIAAHPETRFGRVHDLPMSGSRRDVVRSSNLFALFDCIIDPESGAYLSEDYSFCLRWRRIGGEIWIDAASKLNHCGPYEFVGDHASRFYRNK